MANPCGLPILGEVCNAVGGVAGSVASSAWDGIADSFGDAMASVVKTMLTFWTNVPSPDLAGGGVVTQINGYLYWLQGFVLVLSFLIVAAKMCMNQSGKPAGEALKGLCTLVFVNGAAVTGIDILTKAGDAFSTWVINSSAHGTFGSRLVALTGGSAVLGPLGSGLEFMIALLGIFAAIAQLLLLLIARVGILTVLTGVLPLAASAIGTEAGKAWLQKLLSWIFAFVLYKPVAALIYATAFTLVGTGKDFISVCAGLMLVVLAVFALPAIMRLAVPLVGAATSGGGGAVAGAVAGAALATGAKKLADNRGSSGSGSAPTHKPGLVNSPGAGAAATGAKATGATGAGAGAGAAKLAGLAGPVGAAASAALQGAQLAKGAAESATNS